MVHKTGLVVFSHLRWDFVFQRPQHLLSRFAQSRPVIFVEEPVLDESNPAYLECKQVDEQLLVVRPHTSIAAHGFAGEQLPEIARLLTPLVREQKLESCVAWFYTPLALPLLSVLPHELVVYDCMDALDAFLNAPALLKQREQELLQVADVVFTGGPSLYRRLLGRHENVHCFPSSVDAKHFAGASEVDAEPADQRPIAQPRLGYFGVIDERIDLQLIDEVARQRPQWQFVMVGPVVKISEASLPRRDNIHYLGQKSYADLPDYLAGWDVCLLPFALNESTRFISPTKILEYMAAEKRIISTPITDVVEPYGHIVPIAKDATEFVAACEGLLAESSTERQRRIEGMRQVLSSTSWDATTRRMTSLIEDALRSKRTAAGNTPSPKPLAGPAVDSAQPPVAKSRPVVVIGAGPTGLSATYHLGKDAVLVEQNDKVGGWCRSLNSDGFTFDFAGHIMFSNDPYVHQLYKMLLGDNVHWQDREAWIYSQKTYTRYPFQASLYGLPAHVIKECIIGAIEARYGSLKGPVGDQPGTSNGSASGNGSASATGNGKSANQPSLSACREGDVKDCCGDGVLESTTRLARPGTVAQAVGAGQSNTARTSGNGHAAGSSGAPANFEEFIYKVWGAGIAKHFAIPYNRKLWAVPLAEMETSWLGGRVPMPDLGEMIEGALQPLAKPMGPNARFGYPLRGGFQSLMDGFLPHLSDRLLLGKRVAAISACHRRVTLEDGTILPYEQLVSTMPLPVLIRIMQDEVPEEVRQAASGLRHVSVRCVNLGVGRENLTEKHWIYYPESTVFHRIFVQGNASPYCNPPGGFGLTCEITYSPHKPLPCEGDALIQRCVEDCRSVGIIGPDDPIWTANQVDMPYAYVVYDHARLQNVTVIRKWLESNDIYLAGRYSEWEYFNSDHAFIAGKKIAELVQQRRAGALASPAAATNQTSTAGSPSTATSLGTLASR